MATRSRIAARNQDGTYTSIYVHWDGYPSHHGPILLENYNTEERVRSLLALGDMTCLESSLDECQAGAYATQGEPDCQAQTSHAIDELSKLTQDTGGEWLYVWTGHGWQCAEGGIAFFGMPASKAPADLESLEYWVQRSQREEG